MKRQWDGIYKIASPFVKRMGPDRKIHEGWCAIFLHKCCSCDDEGRDDGEEEPSPPPPRGGTTVKVRKRKKRLERETA